MSYQVLARKYRPTSFEELRGQEHVVQALANALTQQRLHHAYLFTGTRGVGKTTVSRILAKSLNCTGADGQGGITATPCGQCPACRDIDAGRFVDYIQLDAASNRGVEEISQLLDQAVYKPVVGRFKVYMIDEVHMLSNTAFNAMLKTLEEPPDYLKFVLATTDPQKVPVTVLSRCLQFNLRPMAPQTVLEHLTAVLQTEHVAAEPGALRLLARAARGSMRDALSLTDQAIAFGAGALVETQVRQMLGSVDRSHVVGILDALVAASGPDVVAQADALRSLGLSAAGTLEDMATLLQQIAVAQAAPAALDEQDPDTAGARRFAPLLPADELQLLYSMALHGRQELGLAPDEYAGLTMVLLRMLSFRPQGGAGRSAAALQSAAPVRAPAVTPAPTATPTLASAPLVRPTVAVAAVPAPAAVRHSADLSAAAPAPTPRVREETASPVVTPLAARRAEPESPSARLKPRPVAAEERAATAKMTADDLPPWLDAPPADDDGNPLSAAAPVESTSPTAPSPYASTAGQAAALQATPEGERWHQLVKSLPLTALVRELAMQAQCLEADTSPWRLRVERESLRQPALRDKLQAAMSEALGAPQALEIEAGIATDSPALRETAAAQARQRETEHIVLQDPLVQQLLAQYKTARIVPGSIKPH